MAAPEGAVIRSFLDIRGRGYQQPIFHPERLEVLRADAGELETGFQEG